MPFLRRRLSKIAPHFFHVLRIVGAKFLKASLLLGENDEMPGELEHQYGGGKHRRTEQQGHGTASARRGRKSGYKSSTVVAA